MALLPNIAFLLPKLLNSQISRHIGSVRHETKLHRGVKKVPKYITKESEFQ